jgi:phosphate uptake regulator
METRKVQITGKSTFIVSLPKKWARNVKINSGDSVMMVPLPDGTLLIDPRVSMREKAATKKIIPLDSQDNETLFRTFIGAYLAGFNIIEFRSSGQISRATRQEVRDLARKVIGPEVVDESPNSITFNDLLDASDFSLAKGIRRMHIIAKNMHQNAMSVFEDSDHDLVNDIENRDDEVDRLYWLVAKQHNLVLKDASFADRIGATPQEATDFLLVARSLERIADHATRIARNSMRIDSKNGLFKRVAEASETLMELLDDAMRSFGQNKPEYAFEVMNRSSELMKTTNKLLQEVLSMGGDNQSIVSMAYVVDSIERTRSYTEDIAETTIDYQFVKETNSNGPSA